MAPYKKSRQDGCCSVNFLKYVLFIFNFIFFWAGCAVLGVGLWTILEKHHYITLLSTDTYAVITYFLVVAGVLSIIMSVFGCLGIVRENRCILLFYTFMLILIFLMELAAGIMAYVYKDLVWDELKSNMRETFLDNYNQDESKTKAIDQMQREYKCCGALKYDDWLKDVRWKSKLSANNDAVAYYKVPSSCCITEEDKCAFETHPSNIHRKGCLYSFIETNLIDHLVILGAVGVGISLVQTFWILSCCLYLRLREFEYDY